MSYDVDEPIAAETGSPEYFRELDSRVFDPRVLRLTRGLDGRPFSRPGRPGTADTIAGGVSGAV